MKHKIWWMNDEIAYRNIMGARGQCMCGSCSNTLSTLDWYLLHEQIWAKRKRLA